LPCLKGRSIADGRVGNNARKRDIERIAAVPPDSSIVEAGINVETADTHPSTGPRRDASSDCPSR
jgi:hypothetical protein